MKLYYLVEATIQDIQKRIPIFIKKYYPNTPPEQAIKQIELLTALDPTKGKYTEWIIRQHMNRTIRIPEDNEKIAQLLKQFHKGRGQLQDKDISNYTPGTLAKALDEVSASKRQTKKAGRAGSLSLPPGAELVLDKPPYKIAKITNPKAATILCSGTQWCTANIEHAEDYLSGGPLYIVYFDGVRYALAHADSRQLLDIWDSPLYEDESAKVLRLLNTVDKDFGTFLVTVSGDRVPSVESEYLKNIVNEVPDALGNAVWYASTIHGRWPEFERYIFSAPPILAKDHNAAYDYGRLAISREWPDAHSIVDKIGKAVRKAVKHTSLQD